MRILHTSDWHLGRIFHGVHLTDDQAHVLEQLVQLVGEARPDVVLIAGDVYDRAVPPTEAVKLLDEVLSRILIDHQTPVVMISGNHDSPERLAFGRRLLEGQGLHLVGQLNDHLKPIVIEDAYGPVYFCPIPYAEPPLVRERLGIANAHGHEEAMAALVKQVSSRIPDDVRRVILTHAFVAGGTESESERPLSVGGAGTITTSHFMPFHYAALGHLHQPQAAGAEHIRYAGSLMKYSFAEATHWKSVTLVEMDACGKVAFEEIALSPRRDVRCVEGYLNDILSAPPNAPGREDYLMVTLKDTGAILDAIGKLREVYPHVLHIERPHLTAGGELRRPAHDHRRLSESALFASFYADVTGSPLTAAQEEAYAEKVDEMYRKDREVPV